LNVTACCAVESSGFCDRLHRLGGLISTLSIPTRHYLCGLTIIWGMQPDGPAHWSNGWLYDPKDGGTYNVTAELTAPNTISARVFRGAPLFGRTEILIRDPPLSFDGRC